MRSQSTHAGLVASATGAPPAGLDHPVDATEPAGRLLRDLRTSRRGLTSREARRRLVMHGANQLQRHGGHRLWRELGRQFTHPLALLLWAAAGLAWLAGTVQVAVAIVVVIVLNAVFAFVQELQAERAVEALQGYLPQQTKVLRDGAAQTVDAVELVPGDVLLIEEGDRISADVRLLSGTVEVDCSTLTGESVPVARSAAWADARVPLLQARDLVFSGTACTAGEASGVVFATGMRTELGRIATLSQRVRSDASPLERKVRRVAWLIAIIAVLMAIAFLPVATLGGGLSLRNALVFAVGLITGNVPEGLLPVITLALAIGVRELARDGAVVKRLSAVETLGSTDVICTDKTGTLTENRMHVTRLWTVEGERSPADAISPGGPVVGLCRVITACSNAVLAGGERSGDPTELALLEAGSRLGQQLDPKERERMRRRHFHFDPALKLMSTVDEREGRLWVNTKGAPEAVIPRCTTIVGSSIASAAKTSRGGWTSMPPRAFASWPSAPAPWQPGSRSPRTARTPNASSRSSAWPRCWTRPDLVITADQLDQMSDQQLDKVFGGKDELVFARTSPEAKLRIAESLRAEGHVVAMTGDDVNDAPALHWADIGVAMGRSGTDVAREAATMVLTDDNFATIVSAVAAGRRVYDNIRKFIVYIFAHATPEVVPFLFFALGRGAIPLPLTVLQLLAFDVGTETLPALALGREPAEAGLMSRPPRPLREGVIRPAMLLRAWLFLGLIAAALQMGAFFYVLISAGWRPGAPVGAGAPLHHAYLQATTMTFLAMVVGQIGTAFAARTEHASLREVGVFSNRPLLWGIGLELVLTGLIIYLPPLQVVLGTAALPPRMLLITAPLPFLVWGADELRRFLVRRSGGAA